MRFCGVMVEGIGCAGKSELISALKMSLKQAGGYDVRELDHQACDDQYLRYLQAYSAPTRVLFHRGHVSEHVFGAILREGSPFSVREKMLLDQVLSLRFVCVLAEPPSFDAFAARMEARRKKSPYSESQYTEVIGQFRTSMADVSHLPYASRTYHELDQAVTHITAQLMDAARVETT